jgi:hypothetical protein
MADVDMTDAPTAVAPKTAKTSKSEGADSKKPRFEVKKVIPLHTLPTLTLSSLLTNRITVERRRALGMGHRRRQLRHLPQPHHGSMHRVPGQPVFGRDGGVHGGVGYLQSCLPLSLHFEVVKDEAGVPAG